MKPMDDLGYEIRRSARAALRVLQGVPNECIPKLQEFIIRKCVWGCGRRWCRGNRAVRALDTVVGIERGARGNARQIGG